ncbi:MAG: hypothetical protein ACI4W2_00425 [Eubacterium sp.]
MIKMKHSKLISIAAAAMLFAAAVPISASAETTASDPADHINLANSYFARLKDSYVYQGKPVTPGFQVESELVKEKDNGDGTVTRTTYLIILKKGSDYSTEVSGNQGIGTATISVTGKGRCSGTLKGNFKILPAKATLKTASQQGRKLSVRYHTVPGGCSYQLAVRKRGSRKWQYAAAGKRSLITKKITAGIAASVKVRAYKRVHGKMYYGAWSAVKKVKEN